MGQCMLKAEASHVSALKRDIERLVPYVNAGGFRAKCVAVLDRLILPLCIVLLTGTQACAKTLDILRHRVSFACCWLNVLAFLCLCFGRPHAKTVFVC